MNAGQIVYIIAAVTAGLLAAQAGGAYIVYRFIKASGAALAKAALKGQI